MVYASPCSGLTRAVKSKFGAKDSKHKLGARAGKQKFGTKAVKYKLAARAGKYKLGARADQGRDSGSGLGARTRDRGQVEEWGLGNTKNPNPSMELYTSCSYY